MNALTISDNLVDLDDFIDSQYGVRGATARETLEEGYEAFKLGAVLQEMRNENSMSSRPLSVARQKRTSPASRITPATFASPR